jgi:hypothetical protein
VDAGIEMVNEVDVVGLVVVLFGRAYMYRL